MLQNYWKFPSRSVQTFGFVYHDTNGQNHGPVWKTQSFFLSEIWKVTFWQDCQGIGHFSNPNEARLGGGFQLAMLIRTPWTRVIPICACGWHQIGWKETKHSSDVESTAQRSWFGRANIFYWSWKPGMYSKTMWNKQKYCGQLQNHVRIANFRGRNRKITIPSKSSYFFMVLWHGWSCKEVCGTILWVAKKTTQQLYKVSTPCIDDHRFKEEELKSVGQLSKVCSQIVLNCLYLARIGRLDIPWSVNKLARSTTKWTKACDKRLHRLISYIHHTCEYTQYCYVGNIAKQCRLGLFQEFDFAWGLEDSKSTSGGTLCIFRSRTFVPISWMCKKQTSVSHSSTESEIISLDAGLRLDGFTALDWWDLIVSVLGNTTQNHDRTVRPLLAQVKFVLHFTRFTNVSNLEEWSVILIMLILFH